MSGRRQFRTVLLRSGFYVALLVLLVYTVFPFYWALNGSFQPQARLFRTPVSYVPLPPSFSSYQEVFSNSIFVRSLLNSAIVAGVTTLLALAIGSMAACALGRYPMRGRTAILSLVLSMTMFPQISIVGALHTIISRLGLYNTLWGLVLSYMLFTLPFTVWVLTQFLRSLPRELEESAYVDGATPFQTFLYILLPLSLPGVATTGMLAFIAAWNEYLFALSFTITPEARTVPVTIANYPGSGLYETPWGAIMAASVVVTLPLVLLVFIFQRRIVEGMTAGAVKG